MCSSGGNYVGPDKPSSSATQAPPPPPAQPAATQFQDAPARPEEGDPNEQNVKAKRKGRNALRIDVQSPGSTGLNVPVA